MTTYVIAISDVEGNIGEFELCATSIDVEFCNEDDRIFVTSTSLGSPLKGPYKPGEEVRICYELEDWNKLDCNGFQGLVPTFGPGWDTTWEGPVHDAYVAKLVCPGGDGPEVYRCYCPLALQRESGPQNGDRPVGR